MKSHSAVIAVLMSMVFAGQSFAAARSSDVDPARDRIGQIVYPLGVHPPKDSEGTKGIPARDKTSKALTKYPKAKDSGRNKSDE